MKSSEIINVNNQCSSCRNNLLHEACRSGDLFKVTELIAEDDGNCYCFLKKKDRDGHTPLHIAAMEGRVAILKLLLHACPESVQETTAIGDTCLHIAVRHNKWKSLELMLKWILNSCPSSRDYSYLINAKDYLGNTVLHLSTSRRQLQSLRVLLDDPTIRKLVAVNAINNHCMTALDFHYMIPFGGKIDMEIERVLGRAGALTANRLGHSDHTNNKTGVVSQRSTYKDYKIKDFDALAVTAYVMIITFMAPLVFTSSIPAMEEVIHTDTIISILLFNSIGFISSVAVIGFLIHDFPFAPWSQMAVCPILGSHMWLIKKVSRQVAVPLLFLSIPLIFLAAARKTIRSILH